MTRIFVYNDSSVGTSFINWDRHGRAEIRINLNSFQDKHSLTFVLAHELAHPLKAPRLSGHRAEFVCDSEGTKVALTLRPKPSLEAYIDWMTRNRVGPSRTHPSTYDRVQNLEQTFPNEAIRAIERSDKDDMQMPAGIDAKELSPEEFDDLAVLRSVGMMMNAYDHLINVNKNKSTGVSRRGALAAARLAQSYIGSGTQGRADFENAQRCIGRIVNFVEHLNDRKFTEANAELAEAKKYAKAIHDKEMQLMLLNLTYEGFALADKNHEKAQRFRKIVVAKVKEEWKRFK